MSIKRLSPYINFNGSAAQAVALYERVLDAVPLQMTRGADAPGTNVSPDAVVHAALRVGDSQFMLSDSTSSDAVLTEGNVQLALDFDDADEMRRTFTALAEDGVVVLPLQRTFWGATFGMLTDRFGVRWMCNCATALALIVAARAGSLSIAL